MAYRYGSLAEEVNMSWAMLLPDLRNLPQVAKQSLVDGFGLEDPIGDLTARRSPTSTNPQVSIPPVRKLLALLQAYSQLSVYPKLLAHEKLLCGLPGATIEIPEPRGPNFDAINGHPAIFSDISSALASSRKLRNFYDCLAKRYPQWFTIGRFYQYEENSLGLLNDLLVSGVKLLDVYEALYECGLHIMAERLLIETGFAHLKPTPIPVFASTPMPTAALAPAPAPMPKAGRIRGTAKLEVVEPMTPYLVIASGDVEDTTAGIHAVTNDPILAEDTGKKFVVQESRRPYYLGMELGVYYLALESKFEEAEVKLQTHAKIVGERAATSTENKQTTVQLTGQDRGVAKTIKVSVGGKQRTIVQGPQLPSCLVIARGAPRMLDDGTLKAIYEPVIQDPAPEDFDEHCDLSDMMAAQDKLACYGVYILLVSNKRDIPDTVRTTHAKLVSARKP